MSFLPLYTLKIFVSLTRYLWFHPWIYFGQEHGRGKVLETVVEIQDRYDAAKEIEKSLLELHQIFLDMAVMVEAQGEQMDDIEQHVLNAAHYVNDGTKNLKTAKNYQRSSRRCLCIGIILLLLLILVVIIPIATSFSKSWMHFIQDWIIQDSSKTVLVFFHLLDDDIMCMKVSLFRTALI